MNSTHGLVAILTLFLLAPLALAQPGPELAVQAARDYRADSGAQILQEFAAFLRLPNVTANSEQIARNADYIREQLSERGVHAELWEFPGASPLVFGELRVPGAARTLGIYAHYDGQPVDPKRWTQDPWTPTLYTSAIEDGGQPRPMPDGNEPIDPEWRLYGRSSGDDKVSIQALFSALDALRNTGLSPTSNLQILFEGEEESGSAHLGEYLAENSDRLQADLWLICDGPVHPSRRPQLVFGVRGYTGLDITVFGANRYLHSGHYGNWAPNPAMWLSQLLAGMKNADGAVTIEGFYDSTEPVGESERRAMAELPDYDSTLRHELGLMATEGGNAPLAERLLLPSLNIRGLVSAAVGEGARNIIPTQATASLDLRLAKGNDPALMLDLVEAHIRSQGFHIVREEPDRQTRLEHARIARVLRREGYPAARTPLDAREVQEIVEAAQIVTSGERLILLPTMGGSLPLYLFTDHLQVPVLIVPFANHDDNQHSPDENVRLANLWYGIDLAAALLSMPPGS